MDNHNRSKSAQLDREVHAEHDFYSYFGSVITDAFVFFRHEVKWFQRRESFLKDITLPAYFEKTNEKIEPYIPIWKTLKTYFKGEICYHVYKMFYSMLRDVEFCQLPKSDRNLLLWTILMHDISKRGSPVITGKDPIHPFKSAWQTLHYFNDIFKFINLSAEELAEWDEIFNQGFHEKNEIICQNHEIVPRVKIFLDKKLEGKDFEKEVIYFVLLHQSFPTMKKYTHASLLEPLETEIPKYFDKRKFKLFRIFLRHDSFSYLLYSPKIRQAFGEEIDRNIEFVQVYIKDNIE